ncbi:hypothetical protein DFH09DRAFT_1097993 [Mycena vulgaris]|nr:hypothetical protein DFH09DRAFT_1097993 [Mycena vulgaris]
MGVEEKSRNPVRVSLLRILLLSTIISKSPTPVCTAASFFSSRFWGAQYIPFIRSSKHQARSAACGFPVAPFLGLCGLFLPSCSILSDLPNPLIVVESWHLVRPPVLFNFAVSGQHCVDSASLPAHMRSLDFSGDLLDVPDLSLLKASILGPTGSKIRRRKEETKQRAVLWDKWSVWVAPAPGFRIRQTVGIERMHKIGEMKKIVNTGFAKQCIRGGGGDATALGEVICEVLGKNVVVDRGMSENNCMAEVWANATQAKARIDFD